MVPRGPEAEAAVDRLWEHQLRREHGVLLTELESLQTKYLIQEKKIEELKDTLYNQYEAKFNSIKKFMEEQHATLQRLRDRHVTLDTKVGSLSKNLDEIKATSHSLRQRIHEDGIEAEENQIQINTMKRKQNEMDHIYREFVKRPTKRQDINSESDDIDLSGSVLASVSAPSRSQSQTCSPIQPPKAHVSTDVEIPQLVEPSTSSHAAPQNAPNTTARRTRQQKNPIPFVPPPQQYKPLPNPPLEQKSHEGLAKYIARAQNISKTTEPLDLKALAAMFFSGMQSHNEQLRLLQALTERNMAELTAEDKIIMKCKWEILRGVMAELDMGVKRRTRGPTQASRGR